MTIKRKAGIRHITFVRIPAFFVNKTFSVRLLLFVVFDAFDTDALQEGQTFFGPIIVRVNDSFDTGLDNQFRALDAGGRRDVKR